MRHRYIFSGLLDNRKIYTYRLISKPTYSGGYLIRVNIPDDLELIHYPGDSYSITYDERTIDELGYDCYILFNGKWRKFNWLKRIEPHEWYEALEYIFGVRNCCDDKIGFTDDYNLWKNIFFSKERIEFTEKCCQNKAVKHYPHIKEDKNGLTLKVNLQNISNYMKTHDWFKYYEEYEEVLNKDNDKNIFCV